MDVRCGRNARRPDQANLLTPRHGCAGRYVDCAQMGVARDDAAAMVDIDHIAEATVVAHRREDDHAVSSGVDGVPIGRDDIDAAVPTGEALDELPGGRIAQPDRAAGAGGRY